MNNTIRIVAAVVDTNNLTLYKEDGDTVQIPQGDPRVRPIIEEVTPLLISQGYADISIRSTDVNHYAEFEEKSNGIVKFFRIAKDRLKNIFTKAAEANTAPVPPLAIGRTPTTAIVDEHSIDTTAALTQIKAEPPKVQQTLAVVNEIIAHAMPVTDPDFHEDTVAKQGNVVEDTGETLSKEVVSTAPDTIIAVVDGKVIPGMEKIKTQFARAAKLGSTIGVENFLKRLGAVIEQRSHSVEDLLKFMERADMPIADDGSIIIYKVLRRSLEGKYVDCHSGRVEQWVGAYVCMDPSLVDHNRNNECSNGLHVARRGYIRSFCGDVCVLAKLAPEDVIAVPEYDSNKMRVCGYHILMELTPAQYALLNQNRPITNDAEGKLLLAHALAGKHIHRTHEVRITGQMGKGVVVTKLDKKAVPAPVVAAEVPKEAVALDNPDKEKTDLPVDPKAVVQQVEQALSKKQQAQQLYDSWLFAKDPADVETKLNELLAFKKASKKSWNVLGIPDPIAATALAVVKKQSKKQAKKAKKQAAKAKQQPVKLVATATPVASEGSFRDRIQKYLAMGINDLTATIIINLKKQSKKSWDTLGVKPDQVTQILKLIK